MARLPHSANYDPQATYAKLLSGKRQPVVATENDKRKRQHDPHAARMGDGKTHPCVCYNGTTMRLIEVRYSRKRKPSAKTINNQSFAEINRQNDVVAQARMGTIHAEDA